MSTHFCSVKKKNPHKQQQIPYNPSLIMKKRQTLTEKYWIT